MSSSYSALSATLASGFAMIYLGLRTQMLSLPELKVRCGACRRLVWRGRTCACARARD